jgi:hypothetical protein
MMLISKTAVTHAWTMYLNAKSMLLCMVGTLPMMMVMAFWTVTLDPSALTMVMRYNDPFSDPGFDIDIPLSTINVFAAQQRARPPPNTDPSIRLPDSIFSKLSLDDKRTGPGLGADTRRLILGYSWF